MNTTRNRTALAIVTAALLFFSPARADVTWPDTDLARHARTWFEQLSGTEADARDFFEKHFSPAGLEETPIEARLERRRMLMERTGGLVPLAILESTPTRLLIRARESGGQEPTVIVEAEEAPSHLITGIRIELGDMGEPRGPAGPPVTDEEAVTLCRDTLDQKAKSGEFSGAVLLARNGRVLLRDAWGIADREKSTPVRPETRFNLASIGKIPTKIAIARLAEDGKLALDDPLSKYLPDFPRASDITIEMLVDHRSGVGDIFNARYETMDRSKLRHNHDYLDLIRDQNLWFEPGTRERYSNGGYILLGEVIAKASGMDYYDYLAAKVFEPAGMKSTAALLEGDGTPDVARGYTKEGAPAGEERDNVATRPLRGSAAGGSYSTVDDLLALDQALLKGRIVSPKRAEWVTGGPVESPGFGFAGGAPGISTEWTHDGGITLIVLTNRDPEMTQPVVRSLRDIVQRMKQTP